MRIVLLNNNLGPITRIGKRHMSRDCRRKHSLVTSGYPWSDPIRLNIFSYELSLIGIFLGGVPGANVFAPGQNLGWSF